MVLNALLAVIGLISTIVCMHRCFNKPDGFVNFITIIASLFFILSNLVGLTSAIMGGSIANDEFRLFVFASSLAIWVLKLRVKHIKDVFILFNRSL